MKKITIKDIARMSGFSPTVVSFVINDKPGVNENTRKKILEIIEKTNFKPSIRSRRLIYKKSFNVSIIMRKNASPFSDLFYFSIAQGLLEKSKNYGYNIVFTDFTYKNNKLELPEIVEQMDTDGIIFFEDTEFDVLNEIENRNIPYIVINAHVQNHPNGKPIISVSADYKTAAYTATNNLIKNGHRDIAFISFSDVPNFYVNVFSGYKKALDENNIVIPLRWLQIDAIDTDAIHKCVDEILSSENKPTAIFCATDMIAITAMRKAKEMGFAIPDDISFTSIDDIILATYIEPALTTVTIDKSLMGSLAMDLIIKMINHEEVESRMVVSDRLAVRDSVKNINSQ